VVLISQNTEQFLFPHLDSSGSCAHHQLVFVDAQRAYVHTTRLEHDGPNSVEHNQIIMKSTRHQIAWQARERNHHTELHGFDNVDAQSVAPPVDSAIEPTRH
jgi:hypothetical protein